MSLHYSLLDVFAEAPFQGTQIPVVVLDQDVPESTRISIASEFKQTETVFIDKANTDVPVTVYNAKERIAFGAHTTLAASYSAFELGMTKMDGATASIDLKDDGQIIHSYIDVVDGHAGSIQFSRTFNVTTDSYVPEVSRIAKALNIDEKHLSYSKYKPLVVSVDNPVLIVPATRPEHVLAAELDNHQWNELLYEVYAKDILLFAPGTISGLSDFHGRLINPDVARNDYPPIGNVIPEFIGYLAAQDNITDGTHTFTIDRGSHNSRKSILHTEFDKRPGKAIQCRIGGGVVKMGEGSLLI